jgi:signal transduction histidine kinase
MPDLEQHAYGMLGASSVLMGIGQAQAPHGRTRMVRRAVPGCRETADREPIPGGGWTSASFVHDLRNPLATISAGLEMLTCLDSAPPSVNRVVANMSRAARRMRQLLTDLEDATLGRSCPVESCEIGEIIAAAWEAASAAAGNATVQFELDNPEIILLPLAQSRIERVFFNLMANACEAMPLGGKIVIGVRRAAQWVLVSVEDTGPGIPESIRHRLFEPYATAGKEGGLGLGLALARRAVRDHGGDLWIDPTANTRFLIRLPSAAGRGSDTPESPTYEFEEGAAGSL